MFVQLGLQVTLAQLAAVQIKGMNEWLRNDNIIGALEPDAALTPVSAHPAKNQPPGAGEEAEREQATVSLLKECLENEHGECDPSKFKRLPDGRKPRLELARLLKKGELQAFIKSHAEFEVVKKYIRKGFELNTGEEKGWRFKWAAAPSPALGSMEAKGK